MRLLDLFCGAGGAAMGYHRAGFDQIVGVDIKPQPRYPFQFVQADALDFCASFGVGFDAIHASPPCQSYSSTHTLNTSNKQEALIPQCRTLLQCIGKPWIIENVVRSPLIRPLVLDGRDFGLGIGEYGLRRVRWFELSAPFCVLVPYRERKRAIVNVIGKRLRIMPDRPGREESFHRLKAFPELSQQQQAALAFDCDLPLADLSQCVPPAYTEYIGQQLLESLR